MMLMKNRLINNFNWTLGQLIVSCDGELEFLGPQGSVARPVCLLYARCLGNHFQFDFALHLANIRDEKLGENVL